MSKYLKRLISGSIILIITVLINSFTQSINNKFYDLKLKICGNLRLDTYQIKKKIITISVEDEKTIPQIGYPSPFVHAGMIKKLKAYKVNSIFYDFIFKGDVPFELVEATKDAENVYWPVSFDLLKDKKSAFTFNQYPSTFQQVIKKNSIPVEIYSNKLWYTGMGLFQNDNLAKAAKGVGHICTGNEENDENNIFRKAALLINIDGYTFPSIDLLIASDYLKVPRKKIIIKQKYIILPDAKFSNGDVKDIEIPINENGEMLINYIKPWKINMHDFLEPFWFITVLNPEGKQEREEELKERLKDKICLIGNASSVNKDIHEIPIDNNYPGIGIHSNILYTILSGNFIKEVPLIYTSLLTILFLSGLLFISMKTNCIKTFFYSLILMIIYLIISYDSFIIYGVSFPDFIPISSLFLFGSVNFIEDYFIRGKKVRKFMEDLKTLNIILVEKENTVEQTQKELQKLKIDLSEMTNKKEDKILELEKVIQAESGKLNKIEAEREKLIKKISDLSDKVIEIHQDNIITSDNKELMEEAYQYGIITQNKNMLQIFKLIKKFADIDDPVLILGETGTGKGVLAKAIHKISRRKNERIEQIIIPEIQPNLIESELFGHVKGAFTDAKEEKTGKLQVAFKGTVFLDEIGDVPLTIQPKLLRVIEDKIITKVGGTNHVKLDIKIITATNKDLWKEVQGKKFREDLYYRLNGNIIMIPPLRQRKEDIPLLVNHFILLSKKPDMKITKQAMEKLKAYSWPGNVRQLQGIISSAISRSEKDLIELKHIIFPEDSNLSYEDDDIFWNVIKENNFEIEATAKMFDKTRDPVRWRFKGICFAKLSENEWDINKTAEKITDDEKQVEFLIERFNEYYGNIIEVIKEFKNKEDAKSECIRRFKNLPRKYFKYVEEIIDKYSF